MSTMELILRSDGLQALGWTLIHAVWQIAGVAFLLMLSLRLLRTYPARIRYSAAMAAMIVIVLLSAGTFLWYYGYFAGQPAAAQLTAAPAAFSIDATGSGLFTGLKMFVYRYLFVFLGVWLCGVIVLSFRFAGSMYMLHRLRSSARTVSAEWTDTLNRMARQIGINRAVRIAESALVGAPVMIGHLKPLILVPAGMLAAIPADQVAAILAHELAHIRRNDFLVNLLQSVTEILYFFHPGIWWISNVMRRERELCCDDEATQVGCHPVTLAFALSEVGEWMQAERNGKLVLAFSGKKEQPLLARVKRLLGQEPPRSSGILPAGTVMLALIAFLLLSGSGRVFSSSSEEKSIPPVATEQVRGSGATPDTLPSSNGNASVEVRNGRDPVRRKDDTVAADGEGEPALTRNRRHQPSPLRKTNNSAGDEQMSSSTADSLPPAPTPPSMPSFPAPPSPPAPPMPDSVSWSQFQSQMDDFGAAIDDWAKNINVKNGKVKIPGLQFRLDQEQLDEFERSMETFGAEMEKWGEAYGEKMAAWAKANEPRMKEFEQEMEEYGREIEKRVQEQLERRQDMREHRQDMREGRQEMREGRREMRDRMQRNRDHNQHVPEEGTEGPDDTRHL